MNVLKVLELIDNTQGSNAKLDVLRENKDVEYLSEFFRLVEDATVDFGIKKVSNYQDEIKFSEDVQVREFINLLNNELVPRKLTGNAARSKVEEQLSQMNPLAFKWCTRLLYRNLRCGLSGKSIDKIWPGLVVPFKVLLATAIEVDSKNVPIGINFPVRLEPKLDGLRCIAIKHNGIVTLHTRNGNILETLPNIQSVLEKSSLDNFVLDGEAMINRNDAESWNDSASVLMSHKNKKSDVDMTYNVFDAMRYEEWVSQSCFSNLKQRLAFRDQILSTIDFNSIIAVDSIVALAMSDVSSYFNECLDRGYEGIMIKDLNGKYEWKRCKTSVMKYKPIETFDGVIVGIYDGGVGTKNENKFGGLEFLMSNGIVTRIGGGFNDKLRSEIDADRGAFIGRFAEIKGAKGLTIDGKIRFPEFKNFRVKEDVDPSILKAYSDYVSSV